MRGLFFACYRSFLFLNLLPLLKLLLGFRFYYYFSSLTVFHLDQKAGLFICGLALRWPLTL